MFNGQFRHLSMVNVSCEIKLERKISKIVIFRMKTFSLMLPFTKALLQLNMSIAR